MPFWKCAILAFLAIPRRAFAEGEDEPEEDGNEPPDDTEEGDGTLSLEQLQKLHSKMDADSNGKVSMAEVLQFADATRKEIAHKDIKDAMEEVDSDKDGKFSMDEFMKVLGGDAGMGEDSPRVAVEKRKFMAADADSDGFLSEVELPAIIYPETHGGVLHIAAQSTLEQRDADKDGLLTAEEFWEGVEEPIMADFKKFDKDGSGKLDLDELKDWESGRFRYVEDMKPFMEAGDKDNDLHVSSEELVAAHGTLASSNAHDHFMEWATHHEL